jgi:ribosomal protein L23
MRVPFNFRYLHEKPLPRYPLWYPDNPTNRLFLPLFWLRMVQLENKMPENFVKFECHWQMTKSDVKQYLEKLYGVDVLDVRINIRKGEYVEHPKLKNVLVPPLPDRKYAYVQMKTEKFVFPKIFEKKQPSKEMEKSMKIAENEEIKKRNREAQRPFIGSWFF